MLDLGMSIRTDAIGNVVGRFEGRDPSLAPVMMGSHIDTVRTGGRLDGNLGVLAGLEVVNSCFDAGRVPERSLEVGFFTNEEGSRFAPDMMGSLVYTGALSLEIALAKVDADGCSVAEELQRLDLHGESPLPGRAPHAFLELHIEQGPILDSEDTAIGVVTAVQGISWQKLRLVGQSNHAGTAPMSMRRDAALASARITVAVRELVHSMGREMVGTVGHVLVSPNLINVVPNWVEMTVDLRSPHEEQLREAEERFSELVDEICEREGIEIEREQLVRLSPVHFDPALVDRVEEGARALGLSSRRMVSGAGHDAQIFAALVPAAMIFVPSIGGISHNVEEDTAPEDLLAGCQLLSDTVLGLAG